MKYQLIEKPIYSESMLLHFGDKYEMGEIINEHFPDYSGIPVGEVIFENEDVTVVNEQKNQLEVKRLRTLSGAINGFFDDDDYAEQFFTSTNFADLKSFYQTAFDLELIRRTHNEMVVKDNDFYFPTTATDEQILSIQELLGIYFFEINAV